MWSILIVPAGLAIFLLCAYWAQTFLIFPATRAIYRTPASHPFNWEYEEFFVEVRGERTHGWFIPLENARATVLFSHGNAGNIADRLESIQLLRRLGFSVVAYDYGGYGKSTGRPSEKRVYADIEAVWVYVTEERGLAPGEIVLFGRSLGGAATAHLASRVRPKAVVLESTFTSIPDVVRDMPLGRILARGIRHRFPNLERMPHIRVPLLIVHSPDDTLIPFKHGKALFENANPPKEFLEIRGDHNDGFVLSMDIYLAGWEQFLASL